MTRIAVLGLGAMGSRMAARLLAAGHDVAVWNRDPARAAHLAAAGARVAESPRAAAAGADAVLAMVRDDAASRAVWCDPATGALDGLAQGALAPQPLVIECSTLSVAWVRELARAAEARGLAFLDAPVAGSRPQAEAGALIFLAGGEQAVLDRARPLLAAMGQAVHHAGPAGSGAAVKLAVNALLAAQVALLAELLPLLRATGTDPARAAAILAETPVSSASARAAAAAMLAGTHAPAFPIDLAAKDLGLLAATATAAGAAVPLSAATGAVFRAAAAAGHGPENITAIARRYAPPERTPDAPR